MHPYFLSNLVFGRALRRHVDVSGIEHLHPGRSYVFAANHIDWLDGMLLAFIFAPVLHRRIFFVSRSKNYWAYRSTITIDPRYPERVIPQAVAVIQRGHPVCMFIEGRRNTESRLSQPKTGAVRIAQQTGVELVPVGLRGPSGKTFRESIQLVRRNRQRLIVNIGQPRMIALTADVASATREIAADVAELCGKEFHY